MEETIKRLQEKYEKEYFDKNGFVMTSKQKKALRVLIEKTVNKHISDF